MGEVRQYAKHRYWTDEEVEKLKKLSKTKSSNQIARILGRNKSSVESKKQRECITDFTTTTDRMTGKQVSFLVGQDCKSIHNRWKNAGLPLKSYGLRYKVISEKELVEFMQEHHELWRASQCDYDFFSKYEWFLERLKKERQGTDTISHYRNRREWTDYELSKVKMLWKKGLHYTEIAERVGRSNMAVYHKVRMFEDEEWGKRIT